MAFAASMHVLYHDDNVSTESRCGKRPFIPIAHIATGFCYKVTPRRNVITLWEPSPLGVTYECLCRFQIRKLGSYAGYRRFQSEMWDCLAVESNYQEYTWATPVRKKLEASFIRISILLCVALGETLVIVEGFRSFRWVDEWENQIWRVALMRAW